MERILWYLFLCRPGKIAQIIFDGCEAALHRLGKISGKMCIRDRYNQIEGYYYSYRDVDEAGKPIAIYQNSDTEEEMKIPIDEAQIEQTQMSIRDRFVLCYKPTDFRILWIPLFINLILPEAPDLSILFVRFPAFHRNG